MVGIVLLETVLRCRRVTGLLRVELVGDFEGESPLTEPALGLSGFFSDSLLDSEDDAEVDVLLLVPVPEAAECKKR